VSAPFTAYIVRETDATGWFTLTQMKELRPHPGFREWVEQNAPRER